MFEPKYTITNSLLANIKRTYALITELNSRRFPDVILVEYEKTARAASAYASTSVEGNPLPLTEVKKILKSKPENSRDSEKEVLNYNQSLQDLNRLIEKSEIDLSLNLILTVQKQVTAGLLPASWSGKLRQQPVVVNDPRTGQTIYLPPDVKDVKPMLEELINFINSNRKTIDPLLLAGIFHKQMVIIHPFMDGNGRTTRLATKVLLAQMGLNTFNLFSFENYYNKNITKYFQFVGASGNYYDLVDKIDFTAWLEYFTEGIIDELLRVQKQLGATGISPKTSLQPHHEKLLNYIREHGFITDRDYAKLVDRAKATRIQDFRRLIDMGLINRMGKGRATYYVITNNE